MWAGAILSLCFLCPSDSPTEGMKPLVDAKNKGPPDFFANAFAADPADYAANFHLALSYSLLGKAADAVPVYKKVLELKPGLYEAELNLGILLAGQKPANDAIPYLRSAAEKKPKEYRPRFYLAKALFEAGDFANAEESYKLAAGLDSKSAAPQLGWAHSLARQNRLPESAEHFRQAAALDASYRDSLLELASLFEAAKQPAEAVAIYQQFPENIAAQARLGELLIETKRYPEAIDRLEKVVQKDPTPANNLALAQAYLFNKEPQKSIPLL